jgi:hypothetical protein
MKLEIETGLFVFGDAAFLGANASIGVSTTFASNLQLFGVFELRAQRIRR